MAQSNLYEQEFYPSPLQHTWLEFKKSHLALVGLWMLGAIFTVIIIGALLVPHSPYQQNTDALLLPPAWFSNGDFSYLFGTDGLGRDVFSRVMMGSAITFGLSLLLVIASVALGVLIGAYAGMSRGVKSSVINHFLDSIMSIPTLLIAIIIVGILGTGLTNSAWAIVLAMLPRFIHISRDMVRTESRKEYVTAAKLDGATKRHIFIYSIFPNMIEPLVVQSTFALSIAIADVTALGFLNLGAQTPSPELGAMLSAALEYAYLAPWSVAIPGFTICIVIISINLVGDGLRTALRNRFKN